MVFSTIPQERRQQNLILILIGVVLVTLIVLYFGFFRSGPVSPVPTAPEPAAPGPAVSDGDGAVNGTTLKPGNIKDIDIDFLFLTDPRFKDLRKYGEWPIKPGETGRDNPFQPVEPYLVVGTGIEKELPEEELPEGELETLPEEEPEESEEPTGEGAAEKTVEELTLEEILELLSEKETAGEGGNATTTE